MTVTHTFEAVRSHGRYQVTARLAVSGIFCSEAELEVRDTESCGSLTLRRPELMPLLKAVREAVKEVEDAAAGLPSDPVERATGRVPHRGLPTSLWRQHILETYRQELAGLRERFLQRIDDQTTRNQRGLPGEAPG